MIHQTFFNLPEEKRNRIYQCALKEFAARPYDKSSINRVIADASIPKGSFYQYFDNKEDLYSYCIVRLYEIVLEHKSLKNDMILKSGLSSIAKIGLDPVIMEKQKQLEEILTTDGIHFLQMLPKAPRDVRLYAMISVATRLIMPVIRRELEQDPSIDHNKNLDFFAYLISAGEMLAADYGSFIDANVESMDALSFEYLQALYTYLSKENSLCKERIGDSYGKKDLTGRR